MTHAWNERYRALYDRTRRILYDAGIDETLAGELAVQRTLEAALRSRDQLFRASSTPASTHNSGRFTLGLSNATARKTAFVRAILRSTGEKCQQNLTCGW